MARERMRRAAETQLHLLERDQGAIKGRHRYLRPFCCATNTAGVSLSRSCPKGGQGSHMGRVPSRADRVFSL